MSAEPRTPGFAFSDPEFVAHYAEGPPRFVPGFADLHRMTAILLAEKVPEQARLLVLGAGGGLELKAFAERHPDWTFVGVDPAEEMLNLARRTLGPQASRVEWHVGTIETAPAGPFDGACCLLTLHFLTAAERQQTLSELHRRLKPGAPFVTVQASLPSEEEERKRWMARYAAFAKSSGVAADQAESARKGVQTGVTILTPEEDERLLQEAGFSQIGLFYAAFLLRGWVAVA